MSNIKKQVERMELDDPAAQKGELKQLGGSQSDEWNNTVANSTVQALWLENATPETREKDIKAALAGLMGIAPRDELEAMIAAQLIASHHAAMECYRRAMIGAQTFEGRKENLNQANKLSRSHAALLEALNRHRGKGHQKVTVEHVHVHAGGQAIVGNMEAPRGGVRTERKEQPHAKQIADAPEPTMWSPHAEREPVPVARDAERALPDARRKIAGRSEG